ncbi:MAG: PTS sugar transporter subunit IIA [Phycisphaerales bacterium]
MNLRDILTLGSIKVPLAATDKKSAIEELVDALHAENRILKPQTLKDAVWARETTRTTGIGHGLAIPHGKCDGIPNLAMAIGKPATPIDFQSIDSKPVRLIVLLASPLDRTSDHIQALAKISRLMTVEDFRNKVYAAVSPGEVFDLIAAQEAPAAEKV